MVPTADKIELIDRLSRDRPATASKPPASSARNGCRNWPMPPKSSPASTASPACAIRCWCRTNRATTARAPSVPRKSRCSPPPRKPSTSKNINATIDESIERFRPVLERARADGVRVRGYVSTVLGCPYQGEVPVADVVRVASAPARAGLLRDLAGRHHRRRHARARRARCCTPSRSEVPMPRAGRAFPRHLRPGAGQHPRLPGGRRAPWSIRRSPAPAAVLMRRAPAATSPAKTSSTCCTAWASRPASTSTQLSDTGRWLAALLGRDTGSKVGKALSADMNADAARHDCDVA